MLKNLLEYKNTIAIDQKMIDFSLKNAVVKVIGNYV